MGVGLRRKAKRHAAIYIARDGSRAVIAPMNRNGRGGFLVEHDEVELLEPLPDAPELGEALSRALAASRVQRERSYADRRLRDWAAYRASGAKSAKRFEADFIRIHISGANEENIIYELEGWPEKDAELRVAATASSKPTLGLGEQCLAVWRACRDRTV